MKTALTFTAAILLTSTAMAQCKPDSWKPPATGVPSELTEQEYAWLDTPEFAKQKYVIDVSDIKTRQTMQAVRSSIRDVILFVYRDMSEPRPPDAARLELLRKGSTESGFAALSSGGVAPAYKVVGVCFREWQFTAPGRIGVVVEYRGTQESERQLRRAEFIQTDRKWLFDRTEAVSSPMRGV